MPRYNIFPDITLSVHKVVKDYSGIAFIYITCYGFGTGVYTSCMQPIFFQRHKWSVAMFFKVFFFVVVLIFCSCPAIGGEENRKGQNEISSAELVKAQLEGVKTAKDLVGMLTTITVISQDAFRDGDSEDSPVIFVHEGKIIAHIRLKGENEDFSLEIRVGELLKKEKFTGPQDFFFVTARAILQGVLDEQKPSSIGPRQEDQHHKVLEDGKKAI